MKNRNAFTLIELLIVVAIIAILAAIAVPNFIEAQTRSKVSRAQADMRSVATALEAYQVDNNRYPFGRTIWIRDASNPNGYGGLAGKHGLTGWENEPSFTCLQRLTTPVSYISELPHDPFAEGGGAKHYTSSNVDFGKPYYTFYYDDYQTYSDPKLLDGTYRGGTAWADANHSFFSANFHRLNNFGYLWSMHSVGPERRHGGMGGALLGTGTLAAPGSGGNGNPNWVDTQFLAPYDPTNGTVSHGAIARTNKGVFTEVNKGKIPAHTN